MIKLREGSILFSEGKHHVGELGIKFDVVKKAVAPAERINETQIAPSDESSAKASRSYYCLQDAKFCRSAAFPDESHINAHRAISVTQNARFDDHRNSSAASKFIRRHADKGRMANAVNASRSGNVTLLFLELMSKISRKGFRRGSIEREFTKQRKEKAVAYRKVVDAKITLRALGALMAVCIALKALEMRKWGSEPDRAKFRRAIAAKKADCLSKASSYELGSIVVGRLCFADKEVDSALEHEAQIKER